MGLKRNLKNFISFSPVERIQKNSEKARISETIPKTVLDEIISKAIRSEILLEHVNNNHSDKPSWLSTGKLRFNLLIMLVSR